MNFRETLRKLLKGKSEAQELRVGTKFYKYRSLDGDARGRTEAILRNNSLYFSPASAFNDPFEFDAKISVEGTRREIDAYFEATGFDQLDMIRAMTDQQFGDYVRPVLNERNRLGWNATLRGLMTQYGVLCLSSTPYNINLWSNYADSHKGICFEFEHQNDSDFFRHARRVEYLSTPPSVAIVREYPDTQRRRRIAEKIVYSKYARSWDHEEEYRILRNDTGLQNLPARCLTTVYLGCQFNLADPFIQVIRAFRPDIDVVLLEKQRNSYVLAEKWRTKSDTLLPGGNGDA